MHTAEVEALPLYVQHAVQYTVLLQLLLLLAAARKISPTVSEGLERIDAEERF